MCSCTKARVTTMRTMSLCHVIDELHDKHSFADTRAAEEAYFPASLVWRQQIYHLP